MRAGVLDSCVPFLARPRSRVGSTGFPRLTGTYRGLDVDLQLMTDTLTFRKLRALWVLVTCPVRCR